jgi:hypothetical protein
LRSRAAPRTRESSIIPTRYLDRGRGSICSGGHLPPSLPRSLAPFDAFQGAVRLPSALNVKFYLARLRAASMPRGSSISLKGAMDFRPWPSCGSLIRKERLFFLIPRTNNRPPLRARSGPENAAPHISSSTCYARRILQVQVFIIYFHCIAIGIVSQLQLQLRLFEP